MAEVRARSRLDSKGFRSGVKDMGTSVKGFQGQLKNVAATMGAAFGVAALFRLGRESIRTASLMSDLATQSGLTTDQFQALEISALNAGTPAEKIRATLAKLAVVMGQAERGMKTYLDLFDQIGLSQEQLAGKNTAQVLELISQKFVEAIPGSKEYGAILEILGTRSAAQLTEVMQDLADNGLQGMIDKAKEAGQVMDKDMIKRLDEAEDAMQRFNRQMKIGTGSIIGRTLSAWEDFGAVLAGITEGLNLEESIKLAQQLRPGKVAGRKSGATTEAVKKDKELLKLEEAIFKIREKRHMSDLTNAEKLTELEKDRITVLKEEQRLQQSSGFFTKDTLNKQLQRLKIEDEIKKVSDAQAKSFDENFSKQLEVASKAMAAIQNLKITTTGVQSDRLAKIGGQVGSLQSPMARMAEAQMKLGEARNKILTEMNTKLDKLEEAGALI